MMKRHRFSAEQIIRILPEAEALGSVRDVCRQRNIAEQTLYRWRRKCGGMDVSDAKQLRTLEREHAALKRLAELLTHSGRDPNWRRRPSVLDQLRGWNRQAVTQRQANRRNLKAAA
jgi:putative transposase